MTVRMLAKAVLAAALALGAVSAAHADKLRIGTEGAYAPFNMKDSKGEVVGFDIDIAKALCAEMKAECTIVTQDWDGIIPALQNKKFDFIAASMSITEERSKVVSFTDPYYRNKLQFIGKKGVDLDTSVDALKKKTIGAQRATIASEWLEKNLGTTDNVKLYDTQENAWLDLSSGRTDVVLADSFLAYDWLQGDAGKGFEFKNKPVFDDDKIGIAVRKSDTQLLARLNTALKTIIDNGTYDKINAKYFPFSIR
ncbi:ABC transporter substrate-binding protein [Flaviflagellibacter deserti]|jgi:putative lysine/arginine/ornithine/histidine/octopine transport system substrate-binding protein|uniref:ABC transporter substrate-binding protein n=1 Tax=Flaviflagellibacter deserti TaxID=2267266 RepID=A0ABV9Z5D5_9HYPH